MENYRSSVNPRLVEIVNSPASTQEARQRASLALLGTDPGQAKYLCKSFLDALPPDGRVILDILGAQPNARGVAVATSEGELERKPAGDDKAAKRQANAAAALVRLNHAAQVWPLLRQARDPTARSFLIERLAPMGVEPGVLLQGLDEQSDAAVQAALVLALGEYPENQALRSAALPRIEKLLEADDPGLHGAAQWLLRKWNQEEPLAQAARKGIRDREQRLREITRQWAQHKDQARPRWYVNSQGQTMVVIPGTQPFRMGSPPGEEGHSDFESQHTVRISRAFAIAAGPVTNEQFRHFDPDFKLSHPRLSPGPTCPVIDVNWVQAATYCNRLSEKEKIPREQWCYETDADGRVVSVRPNCLSLNGYRLPTEAEWEYTCRAGTVTCRSCGQWPELLDQYGWYLPNADGHTWPVGMKKPNGLGLFEMHGNVWNWCQNDFAGYPKDEPGIVYEDNPVFKTGRPPRMLRGGAYLKAARDVRCADRSFQGSYEVLPHVGFRPARTLKIE
jgi:formylglycine-generating enzyme required for sulfatase activity